MDGFAIFKGRKIFSTFCPPMTARPEINTVTSTGIRYEQIFDESPAPKYIFDLETFRFLAVNDAALIQYGYTRDEFLKLNVTEIRPAGEIELLKSTLSDTDQPTYFDYGQWTHKRKNGEEFYVHIYAHVTTFNGKKARFVMAIDIDQKVRAQQALEEKNAEVAGILENLKAIINNTSDLIWSIDQDFRIISANEAFYKRMELITGKRITQIDHRDFPEETQRKWIGFYERGFKGESFKTVWHEQLPDLDLYEEVSLNPIIGPEGNILGLSCIARNVNDSYLYTRKIEEQNKQLRNIAWIQSHEVRAPLADILGLVSLMKQGLLAEQEQARMIGMLDEAARKLDTVIVRTVRQTHNEG